MRMIRVWSADAGAVEAARRQFVGALRVGLGLPRRAELMRLYRQVGRPAGESVESGAASRCELTRFLRGYLAAEQN